MRRSMGWRAVAVAAMMLATSALSAPAPIRAAELDGPTLLGPAEGSSPGLDVTFSWERLPWAVAYHLQIRLNDADGTVYVEDRTVNDRIAEHVPFRGAVAYWSLSGVDPDGIEGPTSSATFISADLAPTLLAPADGATLTYPDVSTEVRWRSAGEDFEYLHANRDIGDPTLLCCWAGPGSGSTGPFEPGDWRWAAGGVPNPAGELPAPKLSEVRQFTIEWRDSVPQLSGPVDGATIQASQSIHLAWDHVPGAVAYQWQFEPNGNFPAISQYDTGTLGNWGDVSPFLGYPNAGTYQWRVRALMPSSSPTMTHGPWSETRTVAITPLSTPSQTFPADGVTLADWPTLTWTSVAGKANYEIDISDSPDPSDMAAQSIVSAFTFKAPGLARRLWEWTPGPVTRYWRVRAIQLTSGPSSSPWTPWRSFTVTPSGATLASPEVAAPTGPGTCPVEATCPHLPGIPILRWQAVDGTAFYRVFYSPDGGTAFSNRLDVGGTSLVLPWYAETPADLWLGWNVVACPSADDCPTAMPASPAHLKVRLPAPVPLSPVDGVIQVGSSARITWAEPTPSADPDVMLPTTLYEIDRRVAYSDGSPASSSPLFQPLTAANVDSLPQGSTLSWRVRVATLAGANYTLTGAWSPTRTIHRDAPPPTVLTPVEGATVGASPVLSWTLPGYETRGVGVVIVRGTVAMDDPAWNVSPWRIYADGASVVPFPELPPGPYSWRVAGDTDPVDPNAGATIHHFVVAGDPEIHLLGPAPDATVQADSVVLSWTPVANAHSYSVQIGTTTDFFSSQIYVGGGLQLTEHAVAMRLPDGPLYWRACAYLANSTSFSCSETSTVAVANAVATSETRLVHVFAPPGPSDVRDPVSSHLAIALRADATLGTTGGIPARLSWTASDIGTGIGHQDLEMSRDLGAYTPITVTAAARTADVTLSSGHQYHFRVRATDLASNVGAWVPLTVYPKLVQESAAGWAWSSGWTRSSSTAASGGTTRWTTRTGATATTTVYGRSFALVAPRSASRGKAQVWVDGVLVATINLAASPTGSRRLVFVKTWTTVATRRIKIRFTGMPAHTRIDIDAVVALR